MKPEGPPARYVVGIDLGTTNSAMMYIDTSRDARRVRSFAIPQVVAPGQVEALQTLPSFHYQAAADELAPGALQCPWHQDEPNQAVGTFARDHGTLVPGRLIASAKSWLCHSGVDRTAALLPWHGATDVERLSPVEASGAYLKHMAGAWGSKFPKHPLAEQDVILTLPASFDEVARELTVKAAAWAGLPRVVLIEEPQAAFYAWLDVHAEDWQQRVEPGQKILVCDIGGGTSDFTLIRVRQGEDGKVQFHRVAVGDHLILGGDNLDLALAHGLEQRLTDGGRLSPRQWAVLVRSCRQVKETFLSGDPPEHLTVNLPGGGSRLIGGGQQVDVSCEEAQRWLLDGFFPPVGLEEKPSAKQSGFQEFGLPYASDPAITRSLAAFLTAHRHVAMDDADAGGDHDPARPDVVLFNGGLFASDVLRQRMLDVLRSWFRTERPEDTEGQEDYDPLVLDNDRLDLAVARGAAYYGMVRRGEGVRIAAGLARTYYIGVQSKTPSAVCLVPAGIEPGSDVKLTQCEYSLLVSEPVEFPLYVSSTRLVDKPGELVPVDPQQMTPLPPIRTVLKTQKKSESGRVSVHLNTRLTEIGTLDLWCSEASGRRSWRLQFDVRSTTETDRIAHQSAAESEGVIDEETWHQSDSLIDDTFGKKASAKPGKLVKRLAAAIGSSRNQWPASLLRRIWESLVQREAGRRRSEAHEARWLNLIGFSLRPGYGLAVDDWRVSQTWVMVQGKLVHHGPMCRSEGWILWRRIGGGLTAGQQQAVAEPLLGPVRALHRQLTTGKRRGGDFAFNSHETAEVWRLLGSLELLRVKTKIELGRMLLDLLPKRKMEPVRPAIIWALGRIGARRPLYGPLNTVVPADMAGRWVAELLEIQSQGVVDRSAATQLATMEMARRTDDRYRDVSEKCRRKVLQELELGEAPDHFIELVRDGGQLDHEEQAMVFGESLPHGLRMA